MKKGTVLALAVIAAAAILSLTAFLKPIGILSGEEAYYHVMASHSTNGSFVLSQYDYFLKFAFLFFNPVLFMKIFPIIIGTLSVLLFYFIAKKFLNDKSAVYASIILILSPSFLYIFSINSAEIIPLFLILLGVFLLIQKNKLFSYLSGVPFVLCSLSSMFVGVLVFIIYMTHFLAKREKRYDFIAVSALIVFFMAIFNPKFIIEYFASNLPAVSNLFSDLGGLAGISIFAAIFFVAGLIAAKKREYSYPIIIYLVISFFTDYKTIIYSNLLISGFAGLGLMAMIEKKWELGNLKQAMNFLLIGGLLFSGVSHINVIKSLGPSSEIIESAQWLGKNSDNSSVLTTPENSIMVEYFGGKVMFDAIPSETIKFSIISSDANDIYYSRDLEETEKLLNKYNADYILIDSKMTGGEIWKSPDEGLLFLLSNENKFASVYDQGGIRIIYNIK